MEDQMSMNSELMNSQNILDDKKTGLYSYEKDVRRYKMEIDTMPQFERRGMATEDQRRGVLNKLYEGAYKYSSKENAAKTLQDVLNKDKELYSGEKNDFKLVDANSQEGLLNSVRELSYESKMADDYDQRKQSKNSRKRQEKRKKAWDDHRAAALATANLNHVNLQNKSARYVVQDKYALKAEYERTNDVMKTKLTALASMKDADKFDREYNIKMYHDNHDKRAIDMGNGTTKFFQKLAKLRSEYSYQDYTNLIIMDRININSTLTGKEQARFQAESARINKNLKDSNDKLLADVKSVADKFPALINALTGGNEQYSDEIKAFKECNNISKQMAFIDYIMSDPSIMVCIRKDMKQKVDTADLPGAGQRILAELKKFQQND